MHFEVWQWALGILAGLMIGISKTGIPGVGILTVPLLANAFGGWASVGVMLPMLVFADCFAVFWYRRHARWDKLMGLVPWVITGMLLGGFALWVIGGSAGSKSVIDLIIGILVLVMLALHYLQGKFGDRLSPKSKIGVAGTGAAAGFATTVSNAAGPIMQIYMTAHDLPKKEFMGTIAWYFFIFNAAKLPIFGILSWMHPQNPMITSHSLLLDLILCPAILVGVFIGKWMLPRVSQATFNTIVIVLAGLAAIKMIVEYFLPKATTHMLAALVHIIH
ncbi:MAG TPA: sulfite exporter TauE/SafE family protein [Armatimonadota bacterium]